MKIDFKPWKRLSRSLRYASPWLELNEDVAQLPTGKTVTYGVIHFKNRACAVLPIDDEGNTYLVGQYRYALNAYSWELPMGGVPYGEDWLAGTQRELREETGLEAQHWHEFMILHTSNSSTDEEASIYVATGLSQHEPEPEDTEDLTVVKLPLEQAVEWALQGKITDAISVSALLAFQHRRQEFIPATTVTAEEV